MRIFEMLLPHIWYFILLEFKCENFDYFWLIFLCLRLSLQHHNAEALSPRLVGPDQNEVVQTRAIELLYGSGMARYGSDIEIRLVSILLKRPIVVYTPRGRCLIPFLRVCVCVCA